MNDVPTPPMTEHMQGAKAMSTMLLLDLFTRLEAQAVADGGALTIEKLHAVAQAFMMEIETQVLPDEVRVQVHEDILWDKRRRFPFDRLLVHRFSHLISEDDEADDKLFSRRVIPAFTTAITRMIGAEMHEQCQLKTNAILAKHVAPQTGAIDWNAVYEDPKTGKLVNAVLIMMACHFNNFDERCRWLTTVIQGYAPPGEMHPPAGWHFDDLDCLYLLEALFSQLRDALDTDPALIADSYGPETETMLRQFLDGLAATLELREDGAA